MRQPAIFQVDAYLDRLGLQSPPAPGEDSLESLHRAHVYTVPFENFDIHLGRGISLDPADLFRKIVTGSRGGYCFELNGLFQQLLTALGYRVVTLLARVHVRGTPTARHHQVSLVTINGREWLADVGFGGNGLRASIPYELNTIRSQDGIEFRLIDVPPWGTMLQVLENGEWKNLYSFSREFVHAADIISGNFYTSTSPGSHFTWLRIAALPNPEGKVTLVDFDLTVQTSDNTETITLQPGATYLDIIREYFGINLQESYEKLSPLNQPPVLTGQ